MGQRQRYRKRADQPVAAVRLELETEGFYFRKWGAEQYCKQGDWLVNNNGETYTVDGDVFARTYRKVGAGQYVKITPIWAEVADEAGSIVTKEGKSNYQAGDYLVSNNRDGSDAYCISADKFNAMYEPDP